MSSSTLCRTVGVLACLAMASTAAHGAVVTTGLVDWFNPADGVTTDVNGHVTSWANQVAGSNNTGADTHTSLVSGPNGTTLINFNEPNQTSATHTAGNGLRYNKTDTSPTSQFASGYTYFVVFRLDNALSNTFYRLFTGSNDGWGLFLRTSSGDAEVKMSGSDPSRPTDSYLGSSPSYTLGDLAILTVHLTTTSQELYFNGTLVSSTSNSFSSFALSSAIDIGNGVKGDIGQVLLYNNSVTLADIDQTGLQLASDYGVTWNRIVPIPEPASLGVLALGLGTLAFRRR